MLLRNALTFRRQLLAATTAGSKALFAGGSSNNVASDVVDIFDAQGNLEVKHLSEPRWGLVAASTANIAVFAGIFNSGLYTDFLYSKGVNMQKEDTCTPLLLLMCITLRLANFRDTTSLYREPILLPLLLVCCL
jgi:hypothetical protein